MVLMNCQHLRLMTYCLFLYFCMSEFYHKVKAIVISSVKCTFGETSYTSWEENWWLGRPLSDTKASLCRILPFLWGHKNISILVFPHFWQSTSILKYKAYWMLKKISTSISSRIPSVRVHGICSKKDTQNLTYNMKGDIISIYLLVVQLFPSFVPRWSNHV